MREITAGEACFARPMIGTPEAPHGCMAHAPVEHGDRDWSLRFALDIEFRALLAHTEIKCAGQDCPSSGDR
jgi:hypothetical protein